MGNSLARNVNVICIKLLYKTEQKPEEEGEADEDEEEKQKNIVKQKTNKYEEKGAIKVIKNNTKSNKQRIF